MRLAHPQEAIVVTGTSVQLSVIPDQQATRSWCFLLLQQRSAMMEKQDLHVSLPL